MKTIRTFILVFLLSLPFCHAQSSTPGIAEAITPDIQELARGLDNDPTRIFNYVHDHIQHNLYFGSKKGAELTLLEQSGNDFDQCSLMVSLLEAAGYTNNNITYQFGWMEMPYDASNHLDVHHWLNLNVQNNNLTNYDNVYFCVSNLFYNRGFGAPTFESTDSNTLFIQRTWVTMSIGGTNYYLDPAFKDYEPITNINLATAMGFSSNTLMTAASGTDTGNYAQSLNEGALRTALQNCNSNLLAYLSNNAPNATVQQIIGGTQIVSSVGQPLSTSPPPTIAYYPLFNPVTNWTSIPTNFMSAFSISFAGTNYFCYTPQLQGQRLSLTFATNGQAGLWLEDSNVITTTNTGSGSTISVTLNATHPYGSWNMTNNTPIDNGVFDSSVATTYQRTNSSYAITYAFQASSQWLQKRQQKLDTYRQQGYADSSRQVTTETLNMMGLSWMLQTELNAEMVGQEWGQLPHFYHRFGRMAQESSNGYYIDIYLALQQFSPNTGVGSQDFLKSTQAYDVGAYFSSAFENAIIQQSQSSNVTAASTVKMLEIASTNGQAVYLANSGNWSSIRGSLINYGTQLTNLDALIASGDYLLLPQNGSNNVAGPGSWAGMGYMRLSPATATVGRDLASIINGAINGGYSAYPVDINVPYVAQSDSAQANNTNPQNAASPTSGGTVAEPVRQADAMFEVDTTDLTLGQAEPRGIHFARHYDSALRLYNPAGLAYGWTHNYNFNALAVSAPLLGLGSSTPQQMSASIVATCAALNLYNNTTPDPRNWLVTALIAKWSIDQLINNSLSITMGKDTIQFVKQPDGSFTPPANCTMTLTNTGSGYNLLQRHGNTFQFGTNGLLNKIVDQYARTLSLSYNTSNWVSTVTDWTNRTLSFSYTGTPSHLTSITDSAGRTVSYGYTSNASGQLDLTAITDPEGKTSSFLYDTNHQLIVTSNALNQVVVSNVYDGFGRVTTQYTQGNTNKVWQIYWSGFDTLVVDPAGGQQEYLFDGKARPTGMKDALGNLTQIIYDGQDHVVTNISPLNETNLFFYDANNNLIKTIDPLGYTNGFGYDTNFNLIKSFDALGHTNSFTYSTQFSLLTATDPTGVSFTNTYSTSGLLATRSDAGGTINYGYDNYGQLNSVIYPNSLGTNTYINNALGDVRTNLNPKGFTNIFIYNLRRQVTTNISPANYVSKIAYDAVGNVQSVTDANGNTLSKTWSPTRHLLTTTWPTTTQGIPVATNGYDARDWLSVSADPLTHQTLFSNDLAQRLIATVDPLLRTNTLAYDNDGRNVSFTDAALETTRQGYDARGEMTAQTNAATNTVFKSFDGNGNLILLTNRNGNVWHFFFDAANRLTNTTTPTGKTASQSYNARGLMQSVTDAMNQTTTFGYDARGRLTNRTDNVAATTYQFDFNGNRTSVSESGKTNSWIFDVNDRASSFTDSAGNLIQYRYDNNGNLANLVYPGNRTVTYAYDSLNRLTNVTDWASRKTTYTYDLDSRVTSITRPNGTIRSNFYDADGELTNIIEQAASHAPIAFFKLSWNNAAEVQWEFMAPTNLPYTLPTRTLAYDADNRLTNFNGVSIANDNNGNMTYGPLTNTTLTTYVYDARNRLQSAGGVSYGYDAINGRVALTNSNSTNAYVIDPKTSQVLMRIKNGVTNYYVYGLGLIYEEDDTASTTSTLTYHFDYRGSTVALTDNNGNITDRIQYSAYGMVTFRGGTNDTPFQYNGRYGVQTDPNGLLYMRNRYYNPYISRFINADPSGFGGGLNMYAFANGNPISLTDPFGLGAVGENAPPNWINSTDDIVPCIQCHGVSAFGYNGNPNSFSAYIPGSAPDAMDGYQGLESMSVTATKIVGGALIGNVMGPVVSTGLGSLGAWLGDTAISTTATETLQLSSASQQLFGSTQNGVLLGTVENGQINLFQAAAGQIESHSQLAAQGLAGQGAQGFSLVVQDGQVTIMRTFSSLNSSALNYNLPSTTVSQVQNLLKVPSSAVLRNP